MTDQNPTNAKDHKMATSKTLPTQQETSIAATGTNGYGLDIIVDDATGQTTVRVRNTRTGKVHANVALGRIQAEFVGQSIYQATQISKRAQTAAPAPRKHRALPTRPPTPASGKLAQLSAEVARIAGDR